jgi:hypothetical protein
MTNFFHYYSKYFYLEKPTAINEIKTGGFYRMYTYEYVVEHSDGRKTISYKQNETPILLIIGRNTRKKLTYALKLNNLPLRRFLKLYDDIQNQSYTRALIKEIETKNGIVEIGDYTTGAKAILIDKGGKGFYNRTVKQTKDLERYDTYRTYKTPNIKNVKELYFDLSKLRKQLGFKDYDINETT